MEISEKVLFIDKNMMVWFCYMFFLSCMGVNNEIEIIDVDEMMLIEKFI